jgi:hypothetical protein
LQAKERGVASAGASSVMIKSNFTRSKFVILSSYHSKSPALSPLMCIKYREVPENLNAQCSGVSWHERWDFQRLSFGMNSEQDSVRTSFKINWVWTSVECVYGLNIYVMRV